MILNKNKRYLLAVSGGVDSCSLYHYLKTHNYQFCVAHVNHHTRGVNNSYEQLLVESMCQEDHIDCYVSNFYATNKQNFHDEARTFRLNFYKQLVKHLDLEGVILAHHADDNVENFLMHQEAILPCMMKPISYYQNLKIFRPMLNIFKNEIYSYANLSGIIWYEDASNQSDKYTRNKYRLHSHLSKFEKLEILKRQKRLNQEFNNYQNQTLTRFNFEQAINKRLYMYAQLQKKGLYNIKHQLVDDLCKMIDFCGCKEYRLDKNHKFYQMYDQLYIVNNNNHFVVFAKNQNLVYKTMSCAEIKFHKKQLKNLKIPKYLRSIWPCIKSNTDIKILRKDQVFIEVDNAN